MPFDTSLRNAPEAQAKLGPWQEGVKKALKTAGEQHAMEAIQSGVPADHIEKQAGFGQQTDPSNIIDQIMSIAATQIPDPSTIRGPLAIIDAIRGNGFKPLAHGTKPLGFNNATQILSLQNSMNSEARKAPLDQANLIKALMEISQSNPEYKADEAALVEARKGLNEFANTASRGLAGLDKIENAAILLGDFQTGFMNQVGAKSKNALELFAKTPEYVRFSSIVNQELSNIARNLGGEKGVLNNDDITRVRSAIADPTLPLDQKIELLDELRNPIGFELETRLSGAQFEPSKFAKKFKKLSESIDKAKSRTEERIKSRILTKEQAKYFGADSYNQETGEFLANGKVIGRRQ